MCAQCAATASVAIGAATGFRSWLVARAGLWLTPSRKRAVTVALMALGVLGSGLGVGGTG